MDYEGRLSAPLIHARFSIENARSRRTRSHRKEAETMAGDEALTIATSRMDDASSCLAIAPCDGVLSCAPKPAMADLGNIGGFQGEEPMKARFAIALAAMFSISAPALAEEPTGTWLSQSGETRVRIAPCGAALCGTVVWQKTPSKDVNNPDPAKQGRAVVGIQMISGMKPSAAGEYEGQLYNFQDGKTYTGKLKVAGLGSLSLSGCVMGIICRAQTWTRVN
jgi:uncharacterized protein (DUF2147 family)